MSDLTIPERAELLDLEALAVAVATEAGDLILRRPEDLGVASTKSSATDVVTVMDEAAERLLRERISAARPDDGFLGEEGGDRATRSGITWVVDPIDGTVNYLYGIPSYAVSVAAVVGDPTTPGAWQSVAGAVVGPALGETFGATLGGGAWRQRRGGPREAITPGATVDLGHALVGTGFGYVREIRDWQAKVFVEVIGQIRDIRRIGSAALDLCHVADGSLDAFYERMLNPWDLAAGWLVCAESGVLLGGPEGAAPDDLTPPRSELTWACAPGLYPAFPRAVHGAIRGVGPL